MKLGKEVVAKGYTALKTNVLLFGDNPRNYAPGFARTAEGFPELNPDRYVIKAIQEQLAAFREGAGPDMDIMVDLNFNYKTEGFVKMARAMEPFDLLWMELDTRDPKALQYIRSRAPMPVASCESLFGRRDYRPYFENYSVDVAIIDTPWNGVGESVKIANMADTYEINVAPHNFYGPLATMMSAHFCAVVPNLRIMETDPDTVPWHDDLVTVKPAIKDGYISLPTGPGLGHRDQRGDRAGPSAAPAVIVPRALILSAVLVSALLPARAAWAAGPAPAPVVGQAARGRDRRRAQGIPGEASRPCCRCGSGSSRGRSSSATSGGSSSSAASSRARSSRRPRRLSRERRSKLEETRRAIAAADHAMAEATTARALAGLAPAGPGRLRAERGPDPLQRPGRVVVDGGHSQAPAVLRGPLRPAAPRERLRPDAAARPHGPRPQGRARRRRAPGQPGGAGPDGLPARGRHPLHRLLGRRAGLRVGRAHPRRAAVAADLGQAMTRAAPARLRLDPQRCYGALRLPPRCPERGSA